MENKTALFLALAIVALLVVDLVWLDWNLPLEIARKVMALIDMMAVWR